MKTNDRIELLWQQYRGMRKAVLLVALTGLVYVYPFHTDFRFTISVAVLSSLLLYFKSLTPLATTLSSGILIVILRSILDFLGEAGWITALGHNLPTLGYYLLFGLLFSMLRIRQHKGKVATLLITLFFADMVSNCFELLLRGEWPSGGVEDILRSLIGVALLRAAAALAGYYALAQYHAFVLAEDHLAHYAKLLLMIARLKAELFFLKKSSMDMERVMEKSYVLYKTLQELHNKPSSSEPVAQQALAIAREIHEIKKDYYRVTGGIETVLETQQFESGLKLSEIFWLLEQNTVRYLSTVNKQINILFKTQDDFITDKYYTLVAMLDNLIINAIEACDLNGKIVVSQRQSGERMFFTVEDNGHGINEEDIAYIFNAGYSTKYSRETGKMSTGIGLAHVKNLVETLGGEISVNAKVPGRTQFMIEIGVHALQKDEG